MLFDSRGLIRLLFDYHPSRGLVTLSWFYKHWALMILEF